MGQRIMKHSKSLIGRVVHVYRTDWTRPDLPRPGQITGFSEDKGLFGVTVTHDYKLDQRSAGKPPFGFLPNLLIVDDPDDLPVGVNEYGILMGELHTAQEAVSSDALSTETGGRRTKAKESEDKVNQDKPSSEDIDHDVAEEEDEEPEKRDGNDEPDRPTAKVGGHTRVGSTPLEILTNGEPWAPVQALVDMDIANVIEVSENELTIFLDNDDKPIARLTFTPRIEGRPESDIGFTVKLRDQSGRCSKVLDQKLQKPDQVARAMKALANAITVAADAPLGDFTSSSANMDPAIAEYRSGAS